MLSRNNFLECRRHLAFNSPVDQTMVAARTDMTMSTKAPRIASPSNGQPTSSLVERGSNFSRAGRTNPKVTTQASSTGSMRIVNNRLATVAGASEEAENGKRRPAQMQSADVLTRTMKKTAQHSE